MKDCLGKRIVKIPARTCRTSFFFQKTNFRQKRFQFLSHVNIIEYTFRIGINEENTDWIC